jgi:eukaryotic-like serine/threonine-protein kinase
MPDELSMGADREKRLDEIVAGFFRDREEGRAPDRKDLLAHNPDLAAELKEFFAAHDRFEGCGQLVQSLRQAGARERIQSETGATPSLPPLDKFELLGEIGRSYTSVVYKARECGTNGFVALKTIRPGHLVTAAELNRFRVAAEVAARLRHPRIVPVYRVGVERGCPYFSMRLYEGGSLADRLASFADKPRAAAALVAVVARAINEAHRHGLLHGNLKPSNVLLDGQGNPAVVDFQGVRLDGEGSGSKDRVSQSMRGWAWEDAASSADRRGSTGPSSNKGEGSSQDGLAYLAPEQRQAALPTGERATAFALTPAADVYGLGALLFALLTGAPPPFSIRLDAPAPVGGAGATPTTGSPDQDFEAVLRTCLDLDPRKRYPSPVALADDLESWLGGGPIRADRARPVIAATGPVQLTSSIRSWLRRYGSKRKSKP